jgi:hypothetical protein
MTGSWALLQAKQNADTNPLVKAVADAYTNGDARTAARGHVQTVFEGSEVARLKERAVEELRAVASIIDTKAPEDAAAFKAWLEGIAQKAAEAATEGGFMGFGGVAVSDREKATLAEISAALSMGQSDPAKS